MDEKKIYNISMRSFFKMALMGTILSFLPSFLFSQVLSPTPTPGIGLGGQASSLGGLSDEQIQISNKYENQNYEQRELKELCSTYPDLCLGKRAYVISSMGDNVIEGVAKLFGVFGMLSMFMGGGATTAVAGAKQAPGMQMDYCSFIAMGTETVGFMQQSMDQQKIAAELSLTTQVQGAGASFKDRQINSLYKIERSYRSMATNSMIQAGGWGVTTLCYAVTTPQQLLNSPDVLSVNNVLNVVKLAAAGGITLYYFEKKKKADAAADFIESVIKKFKNNGNCNPITELDCYCAQPENQQDTEYCLPKIFSNRPKKAGVITSCVNEKMAADPECKCLSMNSCFDIKFKELAGVLANNTAGSDGLTAVGQLFRGQATSGLSTGITQARMAKAKETLLKIAPPPLDSPYLTTAQQEQAKTFTTLGIPENWSKYLAQMPASSGEAQWKQELRKQNQGGLSALKNIGNLSNSKNRVIEFGSNQKIKKVGEDKDPLKQMLQDMNKKKGSGARNNVIDLNAIESNASLHPSRVIIFEAISHRYQIRTWPSLLETPSLK